MNDLINPILIDSVNLKNNLSNDLIKILYPLNYKLGFFVILNWKYYYYLCNYNIYRSLSILDI